MISKEKVFMGLLVALCAFIGTAWAQSLRVDTDNAAWVQVSANPTFFVQNQCAETVWIKPSAAQPAIALDDRQNAFMILSGGVWVQNVPTSELWWARTASKDCPLVVVDL